MRENYARRYEVNPTGVLAFQSKLGHFSLHQPVENESIFPASNDCIGRRFDKSFQDTRNTVNYTTDIEIIGLRNK